ncbi:ABC transporter ATP-binding protein [Gracilibacillus alcaliphilus]|uniref:ABC transporter ATP-binding protein n=1 Tax=Gracilibacillus alcaliphilus TaxID=1401441 RepID=UPI0019565061|nr:ABC transporter ATP-binding protein [Gracilibacillus alcaliphilus]MBM7677857.1 peptide/nickel transport system ATP-binding protein [Gracilibacillus alcaliphilus]
MEENTQTVHAPDTKEDDQTILEIHDLKTYFHLDEGILKAVDGVDLTIKRGKTLGIVGESGSGKSVATKSILQIVDPPGKVEGEIKLKRSRKGKEEWIDIGKLNPTGEKIRDIRGAEISMIFQEPMKAFSSIHTIGNQITEAILIHSEVDQEEAKRIAIDFLIKVGMSNPEQRFDQYPHELSGGMRQRAMIAMALCCNPAILIADEPTTALDVTVQAQVLDLINHLKETLDTSVIFITHDLGVIAEMSDEVAVMYLGKVIEYTDVETLFYGALHPYTQALLKSIPSVAHTKGELDSIKGTVPIPMNLPKGCGFYSRCKYAVNGVCNVDDIPFTKVNDNHYVRCVRLDEIENRG